MIRYEIGSMNQKDTVCFEAEKKFSKNKIVHISSLRIFVWSYRDSQAKNVKKNKLTQTHIHLKNAIQSGWNLNRTKNKNYTLIQRDQIWAVSLF